ncbi:hypothetical protein OPV22_026680 [Ensete ventricosum]|uniref:Uncharacterized protein n=1 Tax=Ensete ventricosum TaxID=4639 RepID=A0AAV8Q1T7_ENSVE|nr:hypothetical protein OPV22_026680 [Ensete ventricosum]
MIPKPAAMPPPVVVATLPPPLILNEEGHGRSTFIAPDEAVIHIRRFRPNGPLSFSLRKSPSARLARLPSSIRLIGEGNGGYPNRLLLLRAALTPVSSDPPLLPWIDSGSGFFPGRSRNLVQVACFVSNRLHLSSGKRANLISEVIFPGAFAV